MPVQIVNLPGRWDGKTSPDVESRERRGEKVPLPVQKDVSAYNY
jgi:hypothetical protein